MVKNRTCLICDHTGITEKGFCHECRGKGSIEVLEHSNGLSDNGKPDIVMLLLAVSKHTTQDQYASIIKEYLCSPNES